MGLWLAKSLLKYVHFDILVYICSSYSFSTNHIPKPIQINSHKKVFHIITTTTSALKQQQQLIIIVCNAELKICNRRVRELCNKAVERVYYHCKCDDLKNIFLFSGSDIYTYLQSFREGYGVDSKNKITTVANAMDKDN